jgi:hypothetical protein
MALVLSLALFVPVTASFADNAPVAAQQKENKPDFEGRIQGVDLPKNMIAVMDDYSLRYRRIKLKPGMINDYKAGDHVHIVLRAGMNEAKFIEKTPYKAPPAS